MKISTNTATGAQQAFTLVDVMMGMGVLGIVLLSIFASFTFGFKVVKVTREELQATQILQERMELIRLANWTSVTNSPTTNYTISVTTNTSSKFYNVSVSNSIPAIQSTPDYSSELRRIDVSVSWTNNNIQRVRSTSTYVSRYGMQNFKF